METGSIILADGRVLLQSCLYSKNLGFRMKGLLGRERLDHSEGILLKPCRQIHMFFMKFAIDAIFLDRQNRIVHICHAIRPWRISPLVPSAEGVLECQAGLAREFGLKIGDRLEWH